MAVDVVTLLIVWMKDSSKVVFDLNRLRETSGDKTILYLVTVDGEMNHRDSSRHKR
jgi:hypothetical protein